MAARREIELPTIARYERGDFIARYFDYRVGEHVTILAPSGWGKTTFGFQLLAPFSTPEEPSIILAMKPRDETVDKFQKSQKFKRVRSWPPAGDTKYNPRRPPGYVLHPRFVYDKDRDEYEQWLQFRTALYSSMKRGHGVKVFADEVADLNAIGLGDELNYVIRQGRSCGMGVWTATQRPFNAPAMIYGGAMHLFIGNDPDKRSRDRYAEIGGVDRDLVVGYSSTLRQHEWLYIRRSRGDSGTVMCIVGA